MHSRVSILVVGHVSKSTIEVTQLLDLVIVVHLRYSANNLRFGKNFVCLVDCIVEKESFDNFFVYYSVIKNHGLFEVGGNHHHVCLGRRYKVNEDHILIA